MHYILIILIAVLIIVLLCVLVIYHDTHNFVVREYEVKSSKVDKDYTFVLLTDLHGYKFGKDNDRLITAIEKINPSAVLCAGDMLDAGPPPEKLDMETGFSLLKRLAGKYPVYVSNGNHEQKIKLYKDYYGNMFDRYKNRLLREGVVYLENESCDFDNGNIRITGLELDLTYFKKVIKTKMPSDYLDKKLGNVTSSLGSRFQVLIAHNPIYFDEYASWGADLTVSGHVHGGIIRLPLLGGVISPAIALFPKYDGGKYEKSGRTMVLGRGLGTHTIHVRMFNPGEVAVIKVKGV